MADWAAVANVAANVANAISTPIQNKQMQKRQMEENERNRSFSAGQQERQFHLEQQMLKESDSYKVQSLKNAGLNPALAYGGNAPVLTPSGGNPVEGKVAPQMPVGPGFAQLGQSFPDVANFIEDIKLKREGVKQAEIKTKSDELELQHKQNADAVVKMWNDPEARKNIILEDTASLEAYYKLGEKEKQEAETKAIKLSNNITEWRNNIETKYPEFYKATLEQSVHQNALTDAQTAEATTHASLNTANAHLSNANANLAEEQAKTEVSKRGLLDAQTIEAIARANNLKEDTLNKVLDRPRIKAETEKLTKLADYYASRAGVEKVIKWNQLAENFETYVGYLNEQRNKGEMSEEEYNAMIDFVQAQGFKVVANFVGRRIEQIGTNVVDNATGKGSPADKEINEDYVNRKNKDLENAERNNPKSIGEILEGL